MQIAESTPALLIKIADRQELFVNKQKLSWVEIVETIRKQCGITRIGRIIAVRQMVDNGQLTEQEDSSVLNFYLHKNTTEFQKTQQQLVEIYFSKPVIVREGKIKSILENELKEFENGNEEKQLIANDSMLRGRKKSKLVKKEEIQNEFDKI